MNTISHDLVILARKEKERNLTQIGSLVSAHQYFPLYKLFKKYVPKGSKVLDWGTGIGHFSYFLCRADYRTIGFSLEDYSFKPWLKGYNYKFIQGKTTESTKLPFSNELFDTVVSVGVLEHVHEFGGSEIASMKEIARILKPSGLFICYHLPNRLSWIEYIGKLSTQKFHHEYRFTQIEIIQLAKKTGFTILQTGRYGFLPRNSLGRLPTKFAFSKSLAYLWDTLDNILSFIFSPFCQNYFFVARKKN